ncbi:MAG TPA: sulfite exporter TauE/SafE family protein [Myxococcaceae bacterium]|nr:sulfite exporter TauE/SafE family protein [Myxococcaceae bacterium]
MTTHPEYLLYLFLTSIVAGAMNALAGGGTILTFPALLAAGVSPVAANATNAVALVPGSLSAGWAFRRELGRESRRVLITLVISSLAGGLVGAWLVVVAGDALLRVLVPWLVLGATALFMLQEPLRRWRERRSAERLSRGLDDVNLWGLAAAQFVVAVYGGFFGAAMGILMLAELGLVGLTNIHQMNGLKNFAAMCINAIAAVYFALGEHVHWPLAALMAVGTVVGGYAGAWVAQRIGQAMVRWVIIVIGLGIGVYMLVK